MSKLLRSLVVFGAMVGLMSAAGMSSAPAQVKDKEKDKKDEKKDDKGKVAPKEELGGVEVYMAKDGWRYKVTNAEGKAIAIGTVGYDKKEDALKIVEQVKLTLAKAKVEVKDEKKDVKDKK